MPVGLYVCVSGGEWGGLSSSVSWLTCVCAWLHIGVYFFPCVCLCIDAYMCVYQQVSLCMPTHLGVHLYFDAYVWGHVCVCTWCL